MGKLITHEDGAYFHMHKLLGLYCLVHYTYRILSFILFGDMGFAKDTSTFLSILPHFLLHVSSFEFEISNRRNAVYNIIWPEMRWHSMIFAYRSLFAMLAMLWLPYFYCTIGRGIIVLGTMFLADTVTNYYEAKDGTMRGNPFPPGTPVPVRTYTNLFYSLSQVMATLNIIHHRPDQAFLILIPIQTSAFLMTLIRKGFLSQLGWHVWYTVALLLNYWYAQVLPPDDRKIPMLSHAIVFCVSRFVFGANKYLLWLLFIAHATFAYRC